MDLAGRSENREIQLCLNDPESEVDIVIKRPQATMTAVWTCQKKFADAVKKGEIEVFGEQELVAKLPDWLQASPLSQLGSQGTSPELDWQSMEIQQ
jgi:hypothetical protein